jgi:uncharacterized protein (TIGR02246 family)
MPAYNPAEIHTLFRHAFNLGDVEALIALYEPNAVLVVDGKELIGHESIRTTLESFVARRGRMTLETRAVVESQHGLAVPHGDWAIEPPTGMGTEIATRSLSTEVVPKQPDGTWLFVIDSPYTPEQLLQPLLRLVARSVHQFDCARAGAGSSVGWSCLENDAPLMRSWSSETHQT